MIEEERFTRQNGLIGEEATAKLNDSRIAVVGLGGVGGGVVEALARCGIGHLLLMDGDVFAASNLNRQLLCTEETVGLSKAETAAKRVKGIWSECDVVPYTQWLDDSTLYLLDEFKPDFVIDAVDRVTSKLQLISFCKEKNIPVISCMGTGNRTDPTGFRIGTIKDTAGCGCPLAKIMRHELGKRGLTDITVLYSTVVPVKGEGRTPMSISFVPPVAGFILASHAVNTILKK